ncbi:restriction endonuclease subunit S [Lentilactobacillus parabuchneri]|uniref:restriction endonuclease subunit S n=2 Tax=Lentilactobacillus parabuchneri TaxID=152331 RepID=UPI000A11C9D0|nr:restriction endonuclease subunit S [Lentilactobacillus parabuchneri]ORN30785.1 EcoKI restriction-modification system protein HsdS [Lentilactobacillus parabuchneri]ORN32304.1 EcoKI restriction-modification system protein HsdS [Lentilactobacillus parabuchneri]ORN34068.1 EcoKI restriction-modification system protein HsdS [Lentilactobacillus parabuchneri]
MTEIKQPKLRFSGFTDPWEQRKLGDVTRIIGGGTPDSHNPQYWNGEVNWFTPTEIDGSHYVKFSKRKITKEGLKKSSAKLLPAGSVLLTSRATIGDMAIILKPSATNQGFQSIATNANISNEFIYAMEPKIKAYALKHAAGSTFLEISSHEVKNMKIPFPSYDEQSKLGDLSVTIGNLIAANQDKINQLKQLKKLLMQKIFSQEWRFKGFTDPWEQRKFESLFRKSRIKNIHLKYSESDILSVASMEPSANHRHSSDEYMKSYNVIYINDIAFEGHTSKEFKFGRFVMNDRQDGIVSHVFDVFRPITKLSPKFIKYFIHDEAIMQKPLLFSTSNARMLNSLNVGELNNQILSIPSIKEQEKIGKIINVTEFLIAANQKKVDQLKQLKKYLMQNMFV